MDKKELYNRKHEFISFLDNLYKIFGSSENT